MNKYILIGILNCGKFTLGQRAAEILHLPFYDTDNMSCDKIGNFGLLDMLRSSFNATFLSEQYNSIIELAERDTPAIIATGAEITLMPDCAEQNRFYLRKSSKDYTRKEGDFAY